MAAEEMARLSEQLPQFSANEVPTAEQLLPCDENIKIGRLENGVNFYVCENFEPRERVELSVAVRAGSIDEEEHERGMAHLLEHLAFRSQKEGGNSTERFSVIRELERRGIKFGSHTNAYTSFEETVYTLHSVPSDFAARALELLRALVADIRVTQEDVTEEVKVVLEEWRQGKDWTQRSMEKHFEKSFRGTKIVKRMPIGTMQTLQNAKAEDVRAFYQRNYIASNMAIIVVGDFASGWGKIDDILTAVDTAFGSIPSEAQAITWPRPVHTYLENDSTLFFGRSALLDDEDEINLEMRNLPETRVSIFEDHEASATRVTMSIAVRWIPPKTLSAFCETLLDGLFMSMVNRRLERHAHNARPPFAGAAVSTDQPLAFTGDRALTTVSLSVEPATRNEVIPAMTSAWTELERIAAYGFSNDELSMAKVAMLSDMRALWLERDQRMSSEIASECRDHFLLEFPILGPEIETKIAHYALTRATPTDVAERTEQLLQLSTEWRSRFLTVSRPSNERSGWFSKLSFFSSQNRDKPSIAEDDDLAEQLVAAIDGSAENVQRAALEDEQALAARRKAFLTPMTAPGSIKQQATRALPRPETIQSPIDDVPTVAVELELSNGMTVVLSRTTLRKDEILIRGTAPLGLSEILRDADEDTKRKKVVAAQFSLSLASEYGYYGESTQDVRDYLSGRNVRCEPHISVYQRSLAADCAPDDLEHALAVIHRLFSTKLKRDADRLVTFKRLANESLAHEHRDPLTRFALACDKLNTSDHIFYKRPSLGELENFDASFAADVFDDAFAAPQGWRLVFVGALPPPHELEPLLSNWLGSIQKPNCTRWFLPTNTSPFSSYYPLSVRFPRDSAKHIMRAAVNSSPTAMADGSEALESAQTRLTIPLRVMADNVSPAHSRVRNNISLDLAASIVETRLIDVLRFAHSKVYNVSARISFAASDPIINADDPNTSLDGVLVVAASHDPDDTTLVLDKIMAQIYELRTQGPTTEELESALNALENQLAESLRTNRYWADAISRIFLNSRFKGNFADTLAESTKIKDDLFAALKSNAIEPTRSGPGRIQDALNAALPPIGRASAASTKSWPRHTAVSLLPVRSFWPGLLGEINTIPFFTTGSGGRKNTTTTLLLGVAAVTAAVFAVSSRSAAATRRST